MFVFCGECGCICMISICVTDNSAYDYRLYDSYQYECWSAIDYMAHPYDYHLYYSTLTCDYYDEQSVWMSGIINVCLAIRCIDIQSQFTFSRFFSFYYSNIILFVFF